MGDREKNKPGRARRRRIVAALALLVAVAFFGWLYGFLQPGTWRYYSDDVSLRRLARDVKPQFVLWEKASALPLHMDMQADCAEAAISPDGARMVFTRSTTPGNADLFIARWNGASWGNPEPVRALNSKFNEIAPSFSQDGNYLFFSTDRPGGLGGYDIWVARWDGFEYAWPQPLTLMVNSRFDDVCAGSSSGDARLYFSSNRPKHLLAKEDEKLPYKELRRKWAGTDFDIYCADRIPAGVTNREVERAMSILYSLRESALSDGTVMEKLGGNRKTEEAVDRALAWLARTQDTNGCWSIAASGGQGGHDVASTSFALLSFLGRGERHDKPCKYRQTVAKAIEWLLSKENRLTGDIRGAGGTMYDQAIGSLALIEAYGVTRDQDVLEAAQAAAYFIADAQNEENGGWRYQPRSADSDMSVSGWVIMAIRAAELSGIQVPAKTHAGIPKWLKRASSGASGGAFSYQGGGQGSPAMHATGFFCSQLTGLPESTAAAFEAVDNVRKSKPTAADLYHLYYATLSSYQSQGPLWREWSEKMREVLLAAQKEDGSWAIPQPQPMGAVISTALATLSLQAHYRYVPLFGLGYEPPEHPAAGPVLSGEELPLVPEYDRSRPVDELNSTANDLYPTPTRHGDFLYFASSRAGGEGGFDIYRSHLMGRTNEPPLNLGSAINSPADDMAPALRAAGLTLVFSSNRGGDGKSHHLYASSSRIVFQRHDYSNMPTWSWLWDNHAVPLVIIIAGLLVLIVWNAAAGWQRKKMRREVSS